MYSEPRPPGSGDERLEVILQSQLDIALTLSASDFAEQRRLDVARRAAEDGGVGQVESLAPKLQPFRFADGEPLAQRKIEAAHARAAFGSNAGVAERPRRGSGISAKVQELLAGPDLAEVVRLAHHVRPRAARQRAGRIAALLDGQGEAGMARVDAAQLPTAENHVHAVVPTRAHGFLAAEGQVV